MKLLGYTITISKENDETLKRAILDKAEQNAKIGLIQAKLELRHHTFLLEQATEHNRTEAEITGYTEAIERDKKSIHNWESQLRAINHERN